MWGIDDILKIAAGQLIVREKVDANVAAKRMEICRGCDKADFENDKCLECGCFITLKAAAYSNWRPSKNRTEITHCPLGKWNDAEIANAYRTIDGLPVLNN